MKRKEITSSLFVIINGKSVPWENLSETQQKEISIDLNRRAMEAICRLLSTHDMRGRTK